MTKEDIENEENNEDNLYKRKNVNLGRLPIIHLED